MRKIIRMKSIHYLLPFFSILLGWSMVHANTFIWDPNNSDNIELVKPTFLQNPLQQQLNLHHRTFSNPPRCVPIPSNLSLCYGIKYGEMRLPNLLFHETLNEVIEQSNSWIQLIKLGCHPDTQLFLCSLFSPVCLDQTIPPCRSLCENVKQSCEPSMLRHGFSWPPMMQCNLFPIENNMCIESQQLSSSSSSSSSSSISSDRIKPSSIKNQTTETETHGLQRQLMEAICHSDWVIKMGLNQMKDLNQIRVKKYKLIFGNLNLVAPFSIGLNNQSSIIMNDTIIKGNQHHAINNNNNNLKSTTTREKFILIGNGNEKETISVRLIVSWLKNNQQIKKAIRRAKSNFGCKKYLTTNPTSSSSVPVPLSSSSSTSSLIPTPTTTTTTTTAPSVTSIINTINNNKNNSRPLSSKRSRNRNRKKNPNLARIQ